MKAFVTGGTGFVGSHLVEALRSNGFDEIRCLVRSDPKWLSGLDITRVSGTLDTMDSLRSAVAGIDCVFHVAGLTRAREWDTFYAANVRGTLNLLDAIRTANPQVRHVQITSSLAAVGSAEVLIADEDTPFRPISLYGRSKAEMERAIRPYMADLPISIVRPPAVYGPREEDILTFFRSVSRGVCPVMGNGTDPAVSLVFVRDLVNGMIRSALSDATVGRTYFLGSPRPYSWHEVRDATVAALNRRVFTLHIPPAIVPLVGAIAEWGGRLFGSYPALNREKANEIRHACTMCRSDRARADFGYEPVTSLEHGVRETIEWYRSNGWL